MEAMHQDLIIADGELLVDLFIRPLDVDDTELQLLAMSLSKIERATRYRASMSNHVRRAVASRGHLRHILATLLKCRPQDVPLVTECEGKPALRAGIWPPL